jgi:hypothetical protein
MEPIGEPDDEVRISPPADADDRELLTAEGMMRMGNGHPSGKRLG